MVLPPDEWGYMRRTDADVETQKKIQKAMEERLEKVDKEKPPFYLSNYSFKDPTVDELLPLLIIAAQRRPEVKEFYQNSNCFFKFLIRKTLSLPHKVIVLSPSWGKFLESLLPKNRIAVVENFVDLSQFHTYVRKYDAPERPITVLFVGGAGAIEKGLYDTINAARLVLKQYKDILFVFVACSNMKELGTFIEKEAMASHIKLLGYLHGDEKLRIFFESDIFILPSYGEGLPITILEAMAAGLPVIATSVGAIPEIIEDGKNGFLTEPGDHVGLAKKILKLARDIKLRQEIGKNNLAKIERQYGKDLIVSKLSAEYDKLSAE